MAWMEWRDEYSVKVKAFDEHHKKLISFINELFDAMSGGGKGQDVVGGIIAKLCDYTVYHFGAEEVLMKKYAYPGYNAHRIEHQDLVAKVSDFQAKYKKGAALLSLEIMKFLKDWLLNHILKTDMEYSSFFNQKGEF